MRPPDWLTGMLPDSFLTPEQRANRDFDAESRSTALEALQHRLGILNKTIEVYEKSAPFVEAKAAELRRVQDALVFSRGEETIRLQGRAMALYEFVRVLDDAREERERVLIQVREIETTDAG